MYFPTMHCLHIFRIHMCTSRQCITSRYVSSGFMHHTYFVHKLHSTRCWQLNEPLNLRWSLVTSIWWSRERDMPTFHQHCSYGIWLHKLLCSIASCFSTALHLHGAITIYSVLYMAIWTEIFYCGHSPRWCSCCCGRVRWFGIECNPPHRR